MSKILGLFKSVFVEMIQDVLCEEGGGHVREKIEETQLKNRLSENFERYFKERYQSLTISEDFDLHELNDHLIKYLYTRVAMCFIADSSEKRSYYKDALIASSYTIAGADTKAKRRGVYAYVDSFLEVIEKNFISKVNRKDWFLVNRQTDEIKQALATYIETQNEKLQAFISYHNSFAEYIDSKKLEPLKSDSNKNLLDPNLLFHYLNPEIGFVRRDAPFKFLDEFLDDDAALLCLAITGYGGIGKSRLMYQYIRELLHNLEWKAVMLDRSSVDRVCESKEWNYPKNLLLVIDYAAEKAEIIGKWIRAIQQSRSCPLKMRIVLLERQGVTKANEQTIQPLWYQQIYEASGKMLGNIQYPPRNGFYELPLFNKEEMFQVMDMHPQAKSKLTQAVKKEIYNKIVSFSDGYQDERFNTPLIALLLVDAHVNGEDLPDPEQLMEYVIRRNKDSWERTFSSYGKNEDLVKALERSMVYATATGGCDLTKLPAPLADDKELLIDTLEMDGMNQLPALIAGDDQQHHQLEPLKPDIIGEYFVLDYINRNRYADNCKGMIEACWKKSDEFLSFLIRCVRSYLGKFQVLVFEEPPILFQGADSGYQSRVLFEMTTLPGKNLCQEAVKHINRLYQERKELQLAKILAMGLINLSASQEEVEARQTVAELKALSERWPGKPEIALAYAKGLFNLSFEQKDVKARQTVDELKTFSKKWPENPEIAFEYAKGLVNLSARQKEIAACQKTVDELQTLSEQWPESSEIALRYAMGLVNLSTRQEGVAACQKTVDKLKAFSEQCPENSERILMYARGLFNLSIKQEEVEARQTVDELKMFSKQWPESSGIALAYALGLVTFFAKKGEDKELIVSELKELCDKHPEILEKTLEYAKSGVNHLKGQNEPDVLRAIQKLEYLIQNLEKRR
ncbi:MAG: ATP-binding protein [Chloroflexi bacterium]|nr:ATP-binding protein [Chloroflexota bacterium]